MCGRARYRRNLNRIQLVINYACNRKCFNCDAMVSQAPSNEFMTLQQIEKFVSESINRNIKWEVIRILGGELTLHKNIFDILKLLNNYKCNYSPKTKLILATNGCGDNVNNVVKQLLQEFAVEIENSNKTSDNQIHFSPINQAPVDMDDLKNEDLTKGCCITSISGIALNMYGYYQCATAAAIDRVFGFDAGKRQLPEDSDLMDDMFNRFCRLCGHYYHEMNGFIDFDIVEEKDYRKLESVINKNHRLIGNKMVYKNLKQKGKKTGASNVIISPTWEKALKKWHEIRPVLTKY